MQHKSSLVSFLGRLTVDRPRPNQNPHLISTRNLTLLNFHSSLYLDRPIPKRKSSLSSQNLTLPNPHSSL
ncbi:hypothetical protein RchiOBHm_Chr1g0325461 [Rosa chinensis]|uniref:Uncharacterized protein n=1 Tax=Rosa chinensis TaxID=74649 RepID=A0A2P6S9Z2_ROSCH|nr:hypothetical protein RchiOBHm_Chr1g0325461 [Rosa chinensis]